MIKALVFDFDGTILDTEMPEFIIWQEIYAAHGQELRLDDWARGLGTTGGFDPYDHLATLSGSKLDQDKLRQDRQAQFAEMIAREKIRPGVEDYLLEAHKRGLKIGLASSSSQSWVRGHLRRFGMEDKFDTIKGRDDVNRTKPDPELYLAAVTALGVAPEEAIAIEDSPNGLLAAHRAGLFCLAVPNRLTVQLTLAKADLQIDSLTDLPLAVLLERANARFSY